MPGTYQYDLEIKSNVEKLLKDMKQVQDRLDTVEGREYTIKFNIDEKKLSNVISNLEKMLDSLGKGTGDFKQLENLSKELSSIVSEVQSLSKAFGKVDDSGAKTLLSSIQNIDKSLSELSQNILNVNKNMNNMGGNTSGAVKQVENISNAYQDAAKEAEKLADAQSKLGNKTNISSGTKDAFSDKDISASVESATNSIKEENNVLEQNTQKVKENTQAKEQNANVNFNKYDKRLDSYNGKIDKYKTTIDRFNDGGWTSGAYLDNVQAVKNAVKEYETLLNELKGKDASLVTSDDISKLDKYEKKIKDTIATVTNMSASEKGYNFVSGQKELDKIHKLLNENSKMSAEAKAKIKAYYAEIESGNPSMSLDKIHGEILKIYNAEVEAGRAGRTLWDTLKNSGFHQIAAQMAGMVGVYDVINLGKEGLSVVRELNTALTEMRKVSDESLQSLKKYQNTTFDTADAVGTTAKQIQNSTADWMRLGESMNQAAESAKDANVLLNVSEFEGIDEATESLVSMSQAYKNLDKMDIIDVLNNIGNNYSISTDGLATALKDSASALVTANNDLNEAVSLTTAGNAITQDPSKVGAGLRTISLRLVGTEEAKQELSDLGEETDGMITTVSKLRDTIMDATKAASSDGKGFDILDSNGNYKSTYEIMQGLADLYDNIVKKDKELGTNNLNLLLETIAGKNRANIAASILQNGDMLRSVYEDAQNSEGSAEKELNSYLDSIDGKMAQLENRAQEFWFKVIDSETIKNGIDLLSTLLKGATDFVDTVGLLPTILTGVAAAFSFKNVGIDTLVAY
nr:MAG TPA: minor tail protein [Caudoviricetes sp.]